MMVVLVRESALAPWDAAPPFGVLLVVLVVDDDGIFYLLFFVEFSLSLCLSRCLFGFVCEVYFWTLLMVANEQ